MLKEINKIFREFNKNKIDFCILRNWDEIKGDIDILILKKDLNKLRKVLTKEKFIETQKENYSIGFKRIKNLKLTEIHVHLEGLDYNNIIYLNGKNILKTKTKNIPREDYFITSLILHSIINKQKFKDKYKKIIEKNWNKDKVYKILKEEYNIKKAENIIKLVDKKDYKELIKLKKELIIFKANFYNKIKLLFYLIKHQLQKLWFLKEKQKVIAFIGVDGSGKTTACNLLTNKLKELSFNTKKIDMGVYHKRNLLLKILGSIYSKTKNQTESEKIHNITHNFRRKSVIKNLLRLQDLYWRYLKNKFKRKRILIMDRHFTDLFLQSKPDKVTLLLLKMIKNPDILFLIYNDPKIMWKRKKERTPEILKEQMDQLEKYLKLINIKYIKIKTDNKIKSLDKILNKINKKEYLKLLN